MARGGRMNIKDKIKLRKIVNKITTGDLPNKPDGTKIEDMTKRYIAYHDWTISEGAKLIEDFIDSLTK